MREKKKGANIFQEFLRYGVRVSPWNPTEILLKITMLGHRNMKYLLIPIMITCYSTEKG
jgi:hypothetical protein